MGVEDEATHAIALIARSSWRPSVLWGVFLQSGIGMMIPTTQRSCPACLPLPSPQVEVLGRRFMHKHEPLGCTVFPLWSNRRKDQFFFLTHQLERWMPPCLVPVPANHIRTMCSCWPKCPCTTTTELNGAHQSRLCVFKVYATGCKGQGGLRTRTRRVTDVQRNPGQVQGQDRPRTVLMLGLSATSVVGANHLTSRETTRASTKERAKAWDTEHAHGTLSLLLRLAPMFDLFPSYHTSSHSFCPTLFCCQ